MSDTHFSLSITDLYTICFDLSATVEAHPPLAWLVSTPLPLHISQKAVGWAANTVKKGIFRLHHLGAAFRLLFSASIHGAARC
jgi:hypothetical protein